MNAKYNSVKIILAEDNSADADLVGRALREHSIDCELHVVEDGAQAIQQICELDKEIESPAFDLLILDMHLPKESGKAVLQCLRSTAHYRQTPVVVMASEDARLIAEQAVGTPGLIFFDKPSSLDEFMRLGALVRSILFVAKKPGSCLGVDIDRCAGAA